MYNRVIGSSKVCEVCGEGFKVTDEHCFFLKDIVCSWECFRRMPSPKQTPKINIKKIRKGSLL